MRIAIYDPKPGHEYLTKMYFAPIREWALRNGHSVWEWTSLSQHSNSIVLTLADHLNLDTVNQLKNNNNKIVGFSVTDSSYISQSCREAAVISKIDLMFMLTGIQKINEGYEMIVKPDFSIGLEKRQFLPEEDWTAFNMMRVSGRLKSLPYVHWERQPNIESKPYNLRSQKALIRGGHHMRRFILCLKLMQHDLLDINSGFITSHYFRDDMNPQFRYCDDCRAVWKQQHHFPISQNHHCHACTNEDFKKQPIDLTDLGRWNNKCPLSFYAAATLLSEHIRYKDHNQLEKLMNARWLSAEDHLKMLARITFTSDLKWLFSIYAAQRFWDAAMVGCINLLPRRTNSQDYWPEMRAGEHYLTLSERLDSIEYDVAMDETLFNTISRNAKALYDDYMRPSDYSISNRLLKHIFDSIEAIL